MNNNIKYVYHGSPIGSLNIIKPSLSTHGESYVYATVHRVLALLFLQSWNDFIFNVAYGDDGILEITERYKLALEEIYKGKGGYIYTLDGGTFTSGTTPFECEVVSQNEVKVINEEKVDDILTEILELEKNKELRINRYPKRHPDIPEDDSDLVEEAIYFYRKGKKDIIEYCISKHPHLKDRFKELE